MKNQQNSFLFLLSRKWLILLVTIIFAVSSVIFSLILPDKYTSYAVLSPSERTKTYDSMTGMLSQSALGGALFGLGGLGVSQDRNQNIALQMIKSKSFITKFLDRHNILIPLMAAKDWDASSKKFLINDNLYDSTNNKWLNIPSSLEKPYVENIMVEWNEVFEYFVERKTGFITFQITHYSPELVKEWLDLLLYDLNDEIRKKNVEESDAVINFLKGKAENAPSDYLRDVYYSLIREETKKSALAYVSDQYVFDIIDFPSIPQKKSEPWRAMICILGTLFGFILTIMSLIIKRAYDSLVIES